MLDCHSSTGRLLRAAENMIHFTSKNNQAAASTVCRAAVRPAHRAGRSQSLHKLLMQAFGRSHRWMLDLVCLPLAHPVPWLTAPKGASQTTAARARYSEAAAASCSGANMSFLAGVGISLVCFSRCSVVLWLTPASGLLQKCCCLLCSVCPPSAFLHI